VAHVTSEAAVFRVQDQAGVIVCQYLIPIDCFNQMTDIQVTAALELSTEKYLAGNSIPEVDAAIAARCANFVDDTFEVA
jgi:hypothetical protein